MQTRVLLVLAGLLAPEIAAAQEPAWANEQTVAVELSSYKFSPNSIALQAGRPYRLRLENTSSKGHSFASEALFAAATVRPEDLPKVRHGEVEVPAGQTVDVQLVPTQPGEYKVRCTHFLHSAFGMTGTVTVR